MKISIVIPVYNEANYLRACLEAISKLTTKPYEVIVVDNNSSDSSCSVAESFSFVNLIKETKQGIVYSRTTGFNIACGDIIARIDADTIVPVNWLDKIENTFSDKSISALSGSAQYYEIAAPKIINKIDKLFRANLSKSLSNNLYLWGANMAITKKAWDKVKYDVCLEGHLHEDYDLAIHLQRIGLKVKYTPSVMANVSARRIDSDFISFIHYVLMSPRTYKKHGINVNRQMAPLITFCIFGYLPGKLLYRGYNKQKDTFTLTKLFAPKTSYQRVDPTTNVA